MVNISFGLHADDLRWYAAGIKLGCFDTAKQVMAASQEAYLEACKDLETDIG